MTLHAPGGATVPPTAARRSVPANGPAFHAGTVHYRTEFALFRENHGFHFAVWRKADAGTCDDYGFVTELPHIDPHLAFASRRSRDRFLRWLARYRRRFPDGDLTRHKLPPLPGGGRRGLALPRPALLADLNAPVAIAAWAWLTCHCQAGVWFAASHIVFQRASDAVAFKLRWA